MEDSGKSGLKGWWGKGPAQNSCVDVDNLAKPLNRDGLRLEGKVYCCLLCGQFQRLLHRRLEQRAHQVGQAYGTFNNRNSHFDTRR